MEIGFSVPESFSPRLLSFLQEGGGGTLSVVAGEGGDGDRKVARMGCFLCARHLRGFDAFNPRENPLPGRGD